MLVFVYGTLKKGYGNNRVLGNAKFVKEDTLRGFHLFYSWRNHGFPVMQSADEHKLVKGEVWDIGDSQDTLMALDRLEGEGHMYDRIDAVTESGEAVQSYRGCHKAWGWDRLEHTDREESGEDTIFSWNREY